jgi:hypothetical protein
MSNPSMTLPVGAASIKRVQVSGRGVRSRIPVRKKEDEAIGHEVIAGIAGVQNEKRVRQGLQCSLFFKAPDQVRLDRGPFQDRRIA